MRARSLLAASLSAAAVVCASALPAWAGDTVRLNIAAKDTPTLTLAGTATDADILDVRGGGRGGYGGYRGGYGGYRGGYGGYRGGYGYGGYRGGFYGYGGYGVGFYGYGYAPFYRSYYYSPPVIYTYPPAVYYTPISTTITTSPPVVSLSIGGNRPAGVNVNVALATNVLPPQQGQPIGPEATYPYDGGPRQPVPMPKSTDTGVPAPSTGGSPAPNVPLEGRTVSIPAQKAKLVYPAYGDQTPAQNSTTIVRLPR